MYHAIVRNKIRTGFRHLSAGNYEVVLQQFSPSIYFTFAGTHALGGERRGLDNVRQWFQKLFRTFPGLQFEIHEIVVNGWPWNTRVATRFTLHVPINEQRTYTNTGMQFVRIRWGRMVEDYLYEDTQKLAEELAFIAQNEQNKAKASPLLANE